MGGGGRRVSLNIKIHLENSSRGKEKPLAPPVTFKSLPVQHKRHKVGGVKETFTRVVPSTSARQGRPGPP